jgi:hypothetical protein
LIEKEALNFKDSEHVEMEKDCPPAHPILARALAFALPKTPFDWEDSRERRNRKKRTVDMPGRKSGTIGQS